MISLTTSETKSRLLLTEVQATRSRAPPLTYYYPEILIKHQLDDGLLFAGVAGNRQRCSTGGASLGRWIPIRLTIRGCRLLILHLRMSTKRCHAII